VAQDTIEREIQVGKEKIRTIWQDVQVHPVSDKPIHIDFLRISFLHRGAQGIWFQNFNHHGARF
jgi:hypothetical protein